MVPNKPTIGNSTFTGLLAGSLFVLQSFFSQSPKSLDLLQKCSLAALAIAIPGLVLGLLTLSIKLPSLGDSKLINIVSAIFVASITFDLIGIGLFFFHLFIFAGILFFLMAIICMVIFIIMTYRSLKSGRNRKILLS